MIKEVIEGQEVYFHNWWPHSCYKDEWFYQFIKYRNLATIDYPIHFFSVFGDRNLVRYYADRQQTADSRQQTADSRQQTADSRQQTADSRHQTADKFPGDGKLVFFTGENVHHNIWGNFKEYSDYCLSDVDLSLGFLQLEIDNYLRFPLWILYLIKPDWSYQQIKEKIEYINNPKFRLNLDRNRFACHISRHDTNGVRGYFIDLLESIDKVTCAGYFRQNTNELQVEYADNKLDYLRNFRFSICPENVSSDFYVTEKIFESIMAGCIPIYWGNGYELEVEPEILNQQAILRHTGNNEKELFEQVKYLYSSEIAYKEFAQIKPFTNYAADIIWEKLQQLEQRLK